MPRARKPGTTTTRTRKPRAATAGTVNMVDTTADIIKDDEETPAKPPRAQKAGPKKVLSETQKAIADAGAVALATASRGKDNKGLLFTEAQSITHPATRIIGRRLKKLVPDWAKQFIPTKVNIDPDDLADLEEIAVTLGTYALRIITLMVQEFIVSKEAALAKKQQRQATSAPAQQVWAPAPAPAPLHLVPDAPSDEDKVPVGVLTSNGHNPMFNIIGTDLGIEA